MSLKTFAQIGGVCDLTIEEQGQFYNLMKSCVWVLKTGKESDIAVACGVCFNDNGQIITTSYVIEKSTLTIFGREINDNTFHELKIIRRGGSLLILEPMKKKKKKKKKKKEGYDFADISNGSMQITEGQEVYCIMHNVSGLYSFAVGEVSHRKRVIDDITHFQVANIHTIQHSDIVFSSTGHVMGIVVPKLSPGGKSANFDFGHNLVLHFTEINNFLGR